MKVVHLSIENFRGIKSAKLQFDEHTLLVGTNNVGKSTICEALDLVLGPDRLSRFPPVEEFDFYNAEYISHSADGGEPKPIPLRIEVVLIDLSAEVENRCGGHTEFWHVNERRLLAEGEIEIANPPSVVSCLRLETIGSYNPEEDEFEAQTYFSHSPGEEPGQLRPVSKPIKRLFGFLYLRALRTGSRALSLERGSLLDIILRLQSVRTGLWEKAIAKLRSLDIEEDATELKPVLASIEERLCQYVPSHTSGRKTKLHVSQLTREHLRKTMAFFLAMSKDQDPIPFQLAGTGTLNTLVLALLSFIAELQPQTVIFAMEEPEIAVPPHTQRRIADYLLHKTTQAFVTSHSPFIIERFSPSQTLLLSRDEKAAVTATRISEGSGLSDKDYKRYGRRGLTECMLGKGAIVVEGLTEYQALPVIARRLEEAQPGLLPLDLAGVALLNTDGDGALSSFGAFFRALGLKTFAFYDQKKRKEEEKQKLVANFDINCEHGYKGFEDLIVSEVSADVLWTFLAALKATGENGNVGIPAQCPTDDEVRKLMRQALCSNKGSGWAARLFEDCNVDDLPSTAVEFLKQVYGHFPRPVKNVPAGKDVPATASDI
jgi:putative ATP-dependent endonuclease of OLD family